MRCPQCHEVCEPDAPSCRGCGAALRSRCLACGIESAAGARFCASCGKRLGTAGTGERRQLTVVFCDLAGSTALSTRLDPEEWGEVVRGYHGLCTEVVGRFGGHIAQYLGDGVLIYFGYPHALDDAAQRAVHTGLRVVEEVRAARLGLRRTEQPLQVRVGIHTGIVVVGESGPPGASHERLAYGETPNLAARMQELATPEGVVLSSATHQLVHPYFDLEPLGLRKLKGVAKPVEVYRAVGQTGLQTRFDASLKRGLIPHVGRGADLAFLARHWETTRAGEGQVVFISGEPGIGKSRLLAESRRASSRDDQAEISLRCSTYHQNSAFHPLIEALERLLGFGLDDDPTEKLTKLAAGIESYGTRTPETLALFADLLSLPVPMDAPSPQLTPQARKQRTLEALLGWLIDAARRQPLRVVFEDLHWADPSTLELIDLLIPRAASSRICLLLTSREKSRFTRWDAHPHVHHLGVSRLGPDQVATLIQEVVGGKSLPAEIVEQIVQKTDGVPLFVEELTKMVVEADWLREGADGYEMSGPLPKLAIPATLQDSLMARLDQHPTARSVAQLGATLGREFSYALIRAVTTASDAALRNGLDALEAAELLHRSGEGSETRYVFKHALVQDAAYQSLLKSQRLRFHAWTAEALEGAFSGEASTRPEIVAQHYTAAGLASRALPWWHRAGQRAIERSAFVESVNHLERALSLLPELDDSNGRSAIELGLRQSLGVALTATRGYSSEAVQGNYSRAEELCRDVGEAPELFPSLYGLWNNHMLRNERDPTLSLAERIAGLDATPEQRFIGASVRGVTLYWRGAFEESDAWLAQAIQLHRPEFHAVLDPILGEDAAYLPHLYRAWCLLELGRFDEAKRSITRVRALAGPDPAPYVQATALVFEIMTLLRIGDTAGTREHCAALIALSSEQHFPFFLGAAFCADGAAQIAEGEAAEGVARLREGLAIYDAVGELASRLYWLAVLADGCAAAGDVDEGLSLVSQALADQEGSLAACFAPELHRVKGELLRSRDPESAERSLRLALATARSQGGLQLALRAATSLGAWLRERGEREEARKLVSDACAGFAGAPDSPHLRVAKDLLDGLAADEPGGIA